MQSRSRAAQASRGCAHSSRVSARMLSRHGIVAGAAARCRQRPFSAAQAGVASSRGKNLGKIAVIFGRRKACRPGTGSVRLGAAGTVGEYGGPWRPFAPGGRTAEKDTAERITLRRHLDDPGDFSTSGRFRMGLFAVRAGAGAPCSRTRCFPTTPCCSKRSKCRCGAPPIRPTKSRSASPARKSRRRPRTASGKSSWRRWRPADRT